MGGSNGIRGGIATRRRSRKRRRRGMLCRRDDCGRLGGGSCLLIGIDYDVDGIWQRPRRSATVEFQHISQSGLLIL